MGNRKRNRSDEAVKRRFHKRLTLSVNHYLRRRFKLPVEADINGDGYVLTLDETLKGIKAIVDGGSKQDSLPTELDCNIGRNRADRTDSLFTGNNLCKDCKITEKRGTSLCIAV